MSVDVALLNDFAAHGAGDHGSLFEFIVAERSWSEDESILQPRESSKPNKRDFSVITSGIRK